VPEENKQKLKQQKTKQAVRLTLVSGGSRMEYIDIEKSLIPYRFEIPLNDVIYTWEINYNGDFDFFTVDLLIDKKILVQGEKLVYKMPLFDGVADSRFPKNQIIPFDTSGNSNKVGWDTLNESVFLFIMDGDSSA
jgi:hypothetical protein